MQTDSSWFLFFIFFKCICFGGLCSLIFLMQDVHVHLPGWTGGPDAVWNLPGSGVTDGMICHKSAVPFSRGLKLCLKRLFVFLCIGVASEVENTLQQPWIQTEM